MLRVLLLLLLLLLLLRHVFTSSQWPVDSWAHRSRKHRVGLATNPHEINTQAVADTEAQTDILSLTTLKFQGFDPNSLLKMQIKVTSAVRGAQLVIRGGITLAVLSPDHSDHRNTILPLLRG